MIVKTINGELFQYFEQNHYNGLIHGCNCFCDMAAGFARHVRLLYPDAKAADDMTAVGDINKLGTYSFANTDNGIVINAYTQFEGGPNFDIDAYRKCLIEINKQYAGQSFCIPKIGCGIGGASWEDVERVTNEVTPDITITVFDFQPVNNSLY